MSSAQEALKAMGYDLSRRCRGSVLVEAGPVKLKRYAFRYRVGDGHVLYRWGRLCSARQVAGVWVFSRCESNSPNPTGEQRVVSKARCIYVVQYGTFWSLTRTAWLQLLKDGASGNGYNLDEIKGSKRLKRMPAGVIREDSEDERGWYHPNLHQPLDWDPEDFDDRLREEMN